MIRVMPKVRLLRLGALVLTPLLRGGRIVAQQPVTPEDSLVPAAVYVPPSCTGAPGQAPAVRCPLVVFPQVSASIARSARDARAMIEWQRALANQYGMILLVHDSITIPVASRDSLLQRTLRTYAVDPERIALVGYRVQNGCADPTVFRRVALLSSELDGWGLPVCEIEGKQPPAVRVYLAGGLGEPGFVPHTVRQARQLRQAGHTLDAAVLALRGYAAGLEDFERLWRWLSASWAPPAPTSTPAPVAAAPGAAPASAARATSPSASADSAPLLTAHALDQLITFWTRFQREPDSIRTTARLAHQQSITVPVGAEAERFTLRMMETPALAAEYPSVRAALRAAGLTAQQVDAYRRALIVAAANQPPRPALPPLAPVAATSRLGRNIAFLRAHKERLKALGATGMWTTP